MSDSIVANIDEEIKTMKKNAQDHLDMISLEFSRATKLLHEQEKQIERRQAQIEILRWNIQHNKEMNDAILEQRQKNEKLSNLVEEQENTIKTLQEALKGKEEELEDVEALNQTLIMKERKCNDELQEARKLLIQGLKDNTNKQLSIGLKRMGELASKPFIDAVKRKFGKRKSNDDKCMKAIELCSLWEEHLRDPNWYPFRIVQVGGKTKEILNENDEKLKKLKVEYGKEVIEAVKTALTERMEYNPSGRYIVSELWNNDENRKAELKEVVAQMLEQLDSRHKRNKRVRDNGDIDAESPTPAQTIQGKQR